MVLIQRQGVVSSMWEVSLLENLAECKVEELTPRVMVEIRPAESTRRGSGAGAAMPGLVRRESRRGSSAAMLYLQNLLNPSATGHDG